MTCKLGDLVYFSTKNIPLPKGRARKLAPKCLSPFAVSNIPKEGAAYQLDLGEELLKRGINRSFHVSLLESHVPNDDRRFPRRLPSQLPGFSEKPDEWIVDAIVVHHGKGVWSEFESFWKAGNQTWAPYKEVAHLIATDRCCELKGVEDLHEFPPAYPKREDDHEVSVEAVRVVSDVYINGDSGEGTRTSQPWLTGSVVRSGKFASTSPTSSTSTSEASILIPRGHPLLTIPSTCEPSTKIQPHPTTHTTPWLCAPIPMARPPPASRIPSPWHQWRQTTS